MLAQKLLTGNFTPEKAVEDMLEFEPIEAEIKECIPTKSRKDFTELEAQFDMVD